MGIKKQEFDKEEAMDDILMAAAQAAHGHVYYNTKLTRKKRKDNSWQIRIDVYEKYAKPSRKHAAILKEYGVEAVMHRRS
jgi:hypothetical protein